MRPRGIEIAEVSLVQWPAYERAGVLSLSLRSAADQERHESSELLMAQMQELTWSIATRQARRREAADPK
jgi:phage head maturation protease